MNTRMYLIDVRTPREFEKEHMEGAINYNVEHLVEGELPAFDMDAEIKLYCRSGQRSEVAKQILLQHGFANVENLGEMVVW